MKLLITSKIISSNPSEHVWSFVMEALTYVFILLTETFCQHHLNFPINQWNLRAHQWSPSHFQSNLAPLVQQSLSCCFSSESLIWLWMHFVLPYTPWRERHCTTSMDSLQFLQHMGIKCCSISMDMWLSCMRF